MENVKLSPVKLRRRISQICDKKQLAPFSRLVRYRIVAAPVTNTKVFA